MERNLSPHHSWVSWMWRRINCKYSFHIHLRLFSWSRNKWRNACIYQKRIFGATHGRYLLVCSIFIPEAWYTVTSNAWIYCWQMTTKLSNLETWVNPECLITRAISKRVKSWVRLLACHPRLSRTRTMINEVIYGLLVLLCTRWQPLSLHFMLILLQSFSIV